MLISLSNKTSQFFYRFWTTIYQWQFKNFCQS